jgi:hypothetical protein
MNPDPNQPTEQPQVPVPTPAPVADVAAPEAVPVPAPVETATPAPTPFGGVPVASQPVNPFFNPTDTVPIVSTSPPAGSGIPAIPVQGTPVVGGIPPLKKFNKKLLLIIGAGLALLLVVVAVLVYFLYFNITKADYQKALTASTDLVTLEAKSRDSLSSITGSAGKQPSFATADESTKAVTAAINDFTAYQTSVKNYDQQKALHDGDVGKSYKEFKTKYDVYQKYVLAYTKSINSTLEASTKCTDIFKAKSDKAQSETPTFDAYKKQSDDCRAVLVSAQNTDDPDWKSFITAYITYLDEGVPVYKDIYASIAANDYNGVVSKFGNLTPITKKFTDAAKVLADNIAKRFMDTDGSAQSFKAVTDLLDKKANQ